MPSCLRRQWSRAEKMKIVQETTVGGASIKSVAEKYSLHKNQISLWRQLAASGELDDSKVEKRRITASLSLSNIKKNTDGHHPGGRRIWSALEKLRIVSETYENRSTVTDISRKYGVNPNLIYHWRRLAKKGKMTEFNSVEQLHLQSKKEQRIPRTLHRRFWSQEEKDSVVEETFIRENSVSSVARKYNINPSQLFRWRMIYRSGK